MKVNIGRYLKKYEGRTIDIKIEKFDTWSLDNTLALIILPALIQLKHTKNGVPSGFVNDSAEDYNIQAVFDFMQEDKEEVFNKGCAAWETVLDKMIWSFQQLLIEDYDSKYHHGEIDIGWKELEKTYIDPATGKTEKVYEMMDKNPEKRWYDSVGHQMHNERIQEGLELFGKHLRDLWD